MWGGDVFCFCHFRNMLSESVNVLSESNRDEEEEEEVIFIPYVTVSDKGALNTLQNELCCKKEEAPGLVHLPD